MVQIDLGWFFFVSVVILAISGYPNVVQFFEVFIEIVSWFIDFFCKTNV